LHDLQGEIKTLQKRGDFRLAVRRCPRLLEELSRLWGGGSADLSPYYYDFALALKLAGSQAACLKVTAQALKTWPSTLQLEVLDATARAQSSLAGGGFDPRADALLRTILAEESLPTPRGLRSARPALY